MRYTLSLLVASFVCLSLSAVPSLKEFAGTYNCASLKRVKPSLGGFSQVDIKVSVAGGNKIRMEWKEEGKSKSEVVGPFEAAGHEHKYFKPESPQVYREVESASLSVLATTKFLMFHLNRNGYESSGEYCTKKN